MTVLPLTLAEHTFPLWPIVDGACGCSDPDCGRAGKHPRCAWTTWTKGHKDGEGYGIRTGMESGVFVVDCDSLGAVEAFVAEYPEALTTYAVETAKGAHFYFLAPHFAMKTGKNVLGPGIDVRGEGGFVVGPGSMHTTGVRYVVGNTAPVVRASAGLDLACMRDRDEDSDAVAVSPIDNTHRYWSERIERWSNDVQTWPADGSVNLLNLAQTGVRTYELPDDVVLTGLNVYNTRCTPPWSDAEIDHKLTDARTIGTFQVGAGEGVRDALAAAEAKNQAKEAEVRAETARDFVANKPARKRHDPAHKYTYFIGQTRANEEPVKVPRNELNQMLADSPDWKGVFQLDEFAWRIYAVDPPVRMHRAERGAPTMTDANALCAWIEDTGGLVTKEAAWDAIMLTAEQNAYHPVREYLDTLPAEGCPGLLDDLAKKVFGVDGELENDFLRKFLIAAVRRIRYPGTKVDNVLLLVGEQGGGKSSFIETLFGGEEGFQDRQWSRSQMPDIANKDSSLALVGFWCIEMGEMHRIIKAGTDTAKEFITRRWDNYRKPYERSEERQPRQAVLVGTTNDRESLKDGTGDRRYWPITCDSVDIELVRKLRDSIWAEASRLEAAGEVHWHTKEEEAIIARDIHSLHRATDEWTNEVLKYLKTGPKPKELVALAEVWEHGMQANVKDLDKKAEMRLADILKTVGCIKTRPRQGGVRVTLWGVPDALRYVPAVKKVA